MNASVALYQEPSSPSSVSLPPLLDHTTTATATTATSLTDRDSCSYDSQTQPEHVSCFSTIAAAAASAAATTTTAAHHAFNPGFDLAVPPPQMINNTFDPIARFSRNVGVSAFPSLRSLQENLHLPFFFSPPALAAPPPHGGSSLNWGAVSEEGNGGSGAGGKMSMGSTELDCMWTF
ncbi:hypothetical protein POUND7_007130 [Theobroma cacao]